MRSFLILTALGVGFLLLAVDLLFIGGMERLVEASLSPQRPEQRNALLIGANPWPGYEPLFLARDQGHFKPDQVSLVEYPSATLVIKALRNGAINGAALTLDEVMQLRETAVPIQLVALLDYSNGGDAILARPQYPDLSSLKGRNIGFENSALGGFFFSRALDLMGLKQEDFRMVPMQVDEHAQAYSEAKVDAVVTFDPHRTHLIQLGAKEIFNSSQIPGEIVDVLAVRQSFIKEHPEQVQALVDGWFEGLRYLREQREPAMAAIAQRLSLSKPATEAAYRGIEFPSRSESLSAFSGQPSEFESRAQRLFDYMRHHNLLSRPVDLSGLVETRFIKNAP
ncbi:MAG: ABC transporter substrate-binding protein [bacterium]|nr:ABC transporter substrate-binding protein [bacterium]